MPRFPNDLTCGLCHHQASILPTGRTHRDLLPPQRRCLSLPRCLLPTQTLPLLHLHPPPPLRGPPLRRTRPPPLLRAHRCLLRSDRLEARTDLQVVTSGSRWARAPAAAAALARPGRRCSLSRTFTLRSSKPPLFQQALLLCPPRARTRLPHRRQVRSMASRMARRPRRTTQTRCRVPTAVTRGHKLLRHTNSSSAHTRVGVSEVRRRTSGSRLGSRLRPLVTPMPRPRPSPTPTTIATVTATIAVARSSTRHPEPTGAT